VLKSRYLWKKGKISAHHWDICNGVLYCVPVLTRICVMKDRTFQWQTLSWKTIFIEKNTYFLHLVGLDRVWNPNIQPLTEIAWQGFVAGTIENTLPDPRHKWSQTHSVLYKPPHKKLGWFQTIFVIFLKIH